MTYWSANSVSRDAILDSLIAQLDRCVQQTQAQLDASPDQAPYWRGVRFGLELALLEAHKRQDAEPSLPSAFYDAVNQLVFQHLDNLIAVCQAPIKRDLLIYNAKTIRYDLLKAIRHQAGDRTPSDYEVQANPEQD